MGMYKLRYFETAWTKVYDLCEELGMNDKLNYKAPVDKVVDFIRDLHKKNKESQISAETALQREMRFQQRLYEIQAEIAMEGVAGEPDDMADPVKDSEPDLPPEIVAAALSAVAYEYRDDGMQFNAVALDAVRLARCVVRRMNHE